MMKPQFRILSDEILNQIIEEGLGLLMDPGVRIHNEEALKLLADAGAKVDIEKQIATIPEDLVRKAFETAPSEFSLYTIDEKSGLLWG